MTRRGELTKVVPHFGRRFRGRSLIAGQVERREAQRPFSGLRKPVGCLAPPLASGRRNPVRQARDPGASQAPARGLASPWRLPALHSLSERKQRTGGPAPAKQEGQRSVGLSP